MTYRTEPDKRAQWLAGGTMELRPGGNVELRFRHADLSPEIAEIPGRLSFEGGVNAPGRVTRVRPLRLLAITWDEGNAEPSEVTFELEPRGDKVLLVVTHRRLADRATRIDVASGDQSFAAGAYANADRNLCAVFSLWDSAPGMSCHGKSGIFSIGAPNGLAVGYFSKDFDGSGTRYVDIGGNINFAHSRRWPRSGSMVAARQSMIQTTARPPWQRIQRKD